MEGALQHDAVMGEWLRSKRLSCALTLRQGAAVVGLTMTELSMIEQGKRVASPLSMFMMVRLWEAERKIAGGVA